MSSGRLLLPFLICGISFGCGGDSPPATPPTVPVRGKVLVGGKPLAGVRVTFHPQADFGGPKFKPSGLTDREGEFSLSSARANDGAPVGDYSVTFEYPSVSKDPDEGDVVFDRWKGRYSDPSKSKWKLKISDSSGELEPFKLD